MLVRAEGDNWVHLNKDHVHTQCGKVISLKSIKGLPLCMDCLQIAAEEPNDVPSPSHRAN